MPRFLGAGKDYERHEASRPAVVETPNTAGEIMTKDVVSVLSVISVRDVAILLLEKAHKSQLGKNLNSDKLSRATTAEKSLNVVRQLGFSGAPRVMSERSVFR